MKTPILTVYGLLGVLAVTSLHANPADEAKRDAWRQEGVIQQKKHDDWRQEEYIQQQKRDAWRREAQRQDDLRWDRAHGR